MNREKELRVAEAHELGIRIEAQADVQSLIGAAYDLDGLILTAADLGPDVFRLSTGLAGELFQKLVTYRLQTAVVLADFSAYGERFSELAREHARHPQVRFVHTLAEAHAWLTSPGPGD